MKIFLAEWFKWDIYFEYNLDLINFIPWCSFALERVADEYHLNYAFAWLCFTLNLSYCETKEPAFEVHYNDFVARQISEDG